MTGGNERRREIGHLPRQLSNRGPQKRPVLHLINVCFFPHPIPYSILILLIMSGLSSYLLAPLNFSGP